MQSIEFKFLKNLLNKNINFEWINKCQEFFINILWSEPISQYLNFGKPFTITCNASNYAVGCVLSKRERSKNLPVDASKTFKNSGINY